MLEKVTLVFDVDGTLCPIRKATEQYENLVPYEDMVEKIQQYKKEGARIVIFSARNMKTYHGNIGEINAHTAPVLIAWLNKWNIPYDELLFGKPWPNKNGFYIDDRTVRPAEFLKYSLAELTQICEKDRLD